MQEGDRLVALAALDAGPGLIGRQELLGGAVDGARLPGEAGVAQREGKGWRRRGQVVLDVHQEAPAWRVWVLADREDRAGRSDERDRALGPVEQLALGVLRQVQDAEERDAAALGQGGERREDRADLGVLVAVARP